MYLQMKLLRFAVGTNNKQSKGRRSNRPQYRKEGINNMDMGAVFFALVGLLLVLFFFGVVYPVVMFFNWLINYRGRQTLREFWKEV